MITFKQLYDALKQIKGTDKIIKGKGRISKDVWKHLCIALPELEKNDLKKDRLTVATLRNIHNAVSRNDLAYLNKDCGLEYTADDNPDPSDTPRTSSRKRYFLDV